uniref:Ectopic P granules protein 5 n=1 Tax=Ascaris lumbricoides TaxID=6252 RepID=A0A9J2P241_ASCLU
MEAERPRRPKTKPRPTHSSEAPALPARPVHATQHPVPVAASTAMTIQELERRLEELPVDFDELPTTSSANEEHIEEHKGKGEAEGDVASANERCKTDAVDTKVVSHVDGETTMKASESEQLRKPLPTQQAARFENQKADETSVASVPSADITDIPAAIMPELSVFPSAVAVPSIKELPLSAILPQSGAEVESVDALPASSVYPSLVNGEHEGASKTTAPKSAIHPPVYEDAIREVALSSHRQAPPLPAKIRVSTKSVVPETPPMYPALAKPYEFTEQGLLTENQLLAFYHNEIYENIDDFVDSFIQREESPENCLFEYLKRYKEICEKIALNEVDIAECEQLVKNCSANVWTVENRVLNQEGKCGDQRHATGSVSYLVATLNTSRLTELSQLLKRDVSGRLDSSLSLEIQARSLALQIQWIVVDLNNAFMIEHRLTANSAPCFIVNVDESNSSTRLRGALSDAFHFLRFPALPSRFIDSVTGWITELSAVLLKACTSGDQQYLLCQVLRLPSPVARWAAPLLQPYIDMNPLNDRFVIDHFLSMLSILLSPIRGRENFLRRIVSYENDDNSWAILSEDADEGEISLASVNEMDLIAFLDQFGTEALFAKAIQHFASVNRSNAAAQVLTLIAFELVLLKTFNDGLRAYSHPRFRQFCKKIGYALRQSVRFLADFVEVAKDMLSEDEVLMVQKEFDRIMLHAVHYIVGKQSLGLWQFLVDLPYGAVSESCRMRCQLMLRSKETLTVAQLYEIPENELRSRAQSAGCLLDCLSQLPSNDSNYMVSALAAVISCSEGDSDDFLIELLNACFLDESARDNYYKVGSEAIGVLLDKQPEILPRLLLLIDRNIDALDQYAVEILSNAPLAKCRLSESDVGSICGKWLINRSPDHPGSRIARRVLGSMNWGTGSNGEMWLETGVHAVCAETIIKGHMAQCRNTNGLIAKSINKVAKLASKVPDYEQQFDTFCWDILLRLKLPVLNDGASPSTDLAAFYVHIIQRSLASIDAFLSKGLPLWTDLVNAGCYAPSCVVLGRLIALFPNAALTLINNQNFVQTFDRLLHCDQSSYAVQLIAGSDQFPGPTMKLLSSAITYHLTEQYSQNMVNAWIRVLCCKRPTEWNGDKCALYLLDVIARLVFAEGQSNMQELVELLQPIYMTMMQQWKEGSRGVLSWFAADESPPPLIASANLHIAPWASYLLLLAEQGSFDQFYEALYCSMGKHPKYTLEQAVKKAAGKSHFSLSVTRLHYYRWLEFCCAEGVSESTVFPLACQQLVEHLFTRKNYLAARVCYGGRYWSCPASQSLFDTLRATILPRAEQNANKETAVYYKAVGQWLSNTAIFEPNFRAFDDLLLDHFLQLLVAGEMHTWTEFVDMSKMREQRNESRKLYAFTCHLGSFTSLCAPQGKVRTIAEMVARLTAQNKALPFPVLPMHPSLPRKIQIDVADACNSQTTLSLFSPELNFVNEAARAFVTAKDNVEMLDETYVKDYPRLYSSSTTQLSVMLRCGNVFTMNKCVHPVTVTSAVTVSQYQSTVEAALNDNRQKRSNEVATIFTQLLDSSAVHCAHLEFIAAKMHELTASLSGMRAQQLQLSGRALFYQTASSVSSLEMISPASAATYTFVLTKLGQGFIANHAEEQTHLMSLVLGGSHLAHLLTAHFTPHCVAPSELFSLYTSLSQAVRSPSTSSAALSLLSQLDIKKAGEKLPPHQFSQLMPLAFENIISIGDSSSPLYELCTKHFIHSVFHHFPDNFVPGLALALSACDTNSTPLVVFDMIIAALNANDVDSINSKPEVVISPMTAASASVSLAEQFSKSRRELSTRMYSVWSKYMDRLMVLAEFFLYKAVSLSFDCEQPISKLEAELRQNFGHCTLVFGPLVEPFGAGFAAWNPNDADAAACVLDHLVSLMGRVHALYDTYLPPGSENLETLMFNYYATTIGQLARGGTHVHQLVETRFVRLPWNLFWPNLADLALMNKVLSEGAAESAPLITQIVVRVPWLMLRQQQSNQPLDGTRAFYGLLFSMLARCISRPSNYTACRASMPKLLDSLGTSPWNLISVEQLASVSSFIASGFPANALTDSSDVTISFLTLHRRVCFFSTVPSKVLPAVEEYQKQAIYVRTQLALMLRNTNERKWAIDFYKDMIKTVNAIVISRGDTTDQPACLPRELTAFWAHITDAKFGESISKGYCDWLSENCESPLVMLTMRTVVDSLNASQISTALKIVESCITTYFSRTGSCDWRTITNWALLPDFCQQYLLTIPTSENGITPQFLTLNAFVQKSLQNCSSAVQETAILKSLYEYSSGIKPKYVANEAAFVLLIDKVLKLTLRQYDFGLQQGNEWLMRFIEWLLHVHSEEKSTSFFSLIGLAKKQPFSQRIRYVCNILELYLTQQTVSAEKAPRNGANAPVLNSRIQAFKDISTSKLYVQYQSTSQLALPFFTKVQFYHIGHAAELFATVVTSLYTEKFLQGIRYL